MLRPVIHLLLCSALPGLASAGAGAPPPPGDRAPPPPQLERAPDDPLEALYRTSLELGPGAEPAITVRLMAGQERVVLEARGAGLVARPRPARGEPARALRAPEGSTLTLTAVKRRPGLSRTHPIVSEHAPGRTDAIAASLAEWRGRGLAVRTVSVGSVFGIGGRILDNRRTFVILEGPGTAAWARTAAARAAPYLGRDPILHEVAVRRPSATLEIRDPQGRLLASAESLVTFEAEAGGHLFVRNVEFGAGYSWHGREDRGFEGAVHVVADPAGLSVVNAVPLETLLRGLVPAEIYASAHPEALKAQAVTARSEVLAKVGVRHLADPALICAEQHCQVYKGRDATAPSTDRAVAATRGEVLVDEGGRIVDAVYSAICGGHTENNEVVWGQAAEPALRGRPDFLAEGPWLRFAAGIGEADLEAWLDASPPAYCNTSSFGSAGRFRWTRRIAAEEVDRMTAALGVGRVRALEVTGRGVSGRVKALRIVGAKGEALIHRELPIRRLLGNLNSGMFVVRPEGGSPGRPEAFVFKGGGWGHGAGMCQTGAIGMAEQGHDHRAILRHYYNGSGVLPIYTEGR